MGKGGRSRNFRPQMHFPSSLARREGAHPNFRGRPSEASRATRAPDRAELPLFLCNPSGKMTCKIRPANSGLARSGSLNVRAGLRAKNLSSFDLSETQAMCGRNGWPWAVLPAPGIPRVRQAPNPGDVHLAPRRPPPSKSLHRMKWEVPIYIYIYIYAQICI